MRLLLVGDDPQVGSLVKEALEAESYALDWAKDGREALGFTEIYPYDLIVLDVMLPYLDGFSIVHQLRSAKNRTPILMLTARDALEDRVRDLELGADDYLLKPFALAELRARVRALLRRSSGEAGNEVEVGRLKLDLARRLAWWEGRAVSLTGREYALLEFLALHAGGYYPRETLMEHVWPGDSSVGVQVVDTYIRYLRRKLGDAAIETIKGLGYTFRG